MSTAENPSPNDPAGRVADAAGETIARMIDSEPSEQLQSSELRMLSPPHGPGELGWLGHYRIIKVLGQGGMGMVLMAEDTQLGRSVALKVIKPSLGQDLEIRQRFLREARAMALVKSDHVVTIYQVDQKNDTCYMAMELLEGEPLDQWLKQASSPPLKETLRIGREIAQALAAAHARGLIHRDIKPANVWLEGDTRRVKLLDFGLARPQHMDIRLTSTGMILGTPAYMAPEQANGGNVDQRADLFSLGCMLYEMVSGRLPFQGDTTLAVLMAVVQKAPLPPRTHQASIPEPLNDLILRLLAKDPADRPESAQAAIAQLQAIEGALTLPGAAAAGTAPPDAGAAAARSANPLEQATRMFAAGDTPAAGLKSGPRAHVLLVEPSRTQAAIMRSYLQNQGIQDIVAVVSGQEALEAVRGRRPDAIIASLHLSDMTGVQLAHQVHSEFVACSPGFVLITSASETPEVDALGGRSSYLHKPFTPEQLVEALKQVLPTAATGRGQLRVLIVDDSAPARLHVRNVLGGLGLTQFVEAADGARAIAAVAGAAFQLIVTDYHMPHLDGRGLVGYLKENPATTAVPIIMVTTETDPAKLAAVRQLGVTVCDKSFRPEIVREILDQLLGKS